MVRCGDAMLIKKSSQGFERCVVAQEGDHVQRSGNEYDEWKMEVVSGCEHGGVWSHCSRLRAHTKLLETSHPLLLSQACQAKLGMVKRVRDGNLAADVQVCDQEW